MDLSGGEIAGLVLGPTGVLAGAWAVVKWIGASWSAREKYVDARLQAYVGTLEKDIAALRLASERRELRMGRLEAVTQMLLVEVARHDPKSGALQRASQLLNISYPMPGETPDNMADLMDEMHHREGKK